MAVWLRENVKNNHRTINDRHKFVIDLSGNAGNLGVSLNNSVNDKRSLYTESH
ncbi:hypothetical protein [Bartonella rattaustraliani]|uniref:hypothetical protein n=1 Tax=Bartonella rattaustraliani TaxID=481139 RepID=UPI00178C5AAC